MRFKTFTMQKVISLGNYESQRLEVTVEVDTCDPKLAEEYIDKLNDFISGQLDQIRDEHHEYRAFKLALSEKRGYPKPLDKESELASSDPDLTTNDLPW